TNELGFYLIKRKNDDFFFHEEDLLGTTTLRLIKDRLIEEIIYIDAEIRSEIYDLDKMSEEIAEQLKEMGLIWDTIHEQFELLILNLIIRNSINMGFLETDRDKLMERVTQSKKLSKSIEGRKLKESILNGLMIEKNLNILTIIK
ncbi:MAG: hypothetical protein ACFFA6_17590, partial [Promethearchaeota archaeon]